MPSTPMTTIRLLKIMLSLILLTCVGLMYLVLYSPSILLNSLLLLAVGIAGRERALLLMAVMAPLVINQPGSMSLMPLFLILQIGMAVGFLWDRRAVSPLIARPFPEPLKFFLLLAGISWALALVAPAVMLAQFPGDAIMHRFRWIVFGTFMHFATTLYYPFLLTIQLVVTIVIMWGVWRHADMLLLVRWFRIMGLTILVLAALGLLDFFGARGEQGWFDLYWFRRYNLFIERIGYRRLMSLSGHSGWLAQYMVLFFPALWLGASRGRRGHLFIAGATALTAGTILLTFQRAGWISFGVSLLLCLYFFWREARRGDSHIGLTPLIGRARWATLPALLAIGILLAVAGAAALKWNTVIHRLGEIVELGDRLNYFVTGAHMLQRAPMGVGLGLHGLVYVSQFLPYSRWYMLDNLEAHNTWLTVLTEQGPVALIGWVGTFAILALSLRRIWREADSHRRWQGLLMWTGLAGILVYSWFQYFFFIRVVEFGIWLIGLALAREFGPREARAIPGWRRWVAVAACVQIICLPLNHYMQFPNRGLLGDFDNGFTVWTTDRIEVAIDDEATRIEFDLLSRLPDQDVVIMYPDGVEEKFTMQAGEQRSIRKDIALQDQFPGPFEIFEMRASKTEIGDVLSPMKDDGTVNDDRRRLGVYIMNFRYETPFAAERREKWAREKAAEERQRERKEERDRELDAERHSR